MFFLVYRLALLFRLMTYFEDEVLFEESSQEFDEWSDDSDLFGDEIKNARPFAWLNIGVAQKWGFNPASDWSTTKERTELILGTTGSVSDTDTVN